MEQDKNLQEQLNEEETGNLPEKEWKAEGLILISPSHVSTPARKTLHNK